MVKVSQTCLIVAGQVKRACTNTFHAEECRNDARSVRCIEERRALSCVRINLLMFGKRVACSIIDHGIVGAVRKSVSCQVVDSANVMRRQSSSDAGVPLGIVRIR